MRFENNENPKLVHRLDKDTSGIIVLARTRNIAEILSDYFKNKDENLEKIYLAIVVGKPSNDEGKIDIPLIKKVENGVEKVYKDTIDGKEAITLYKVLNYSSNLNISLLELKILTGRTHQIRVHLKEIGCPILGDGKYGGKKAFVDNITNNMQLHSYKLVINDLYGKNIELVADLPDETRRIVELFRK